MQDHINNTGGAIVQFFRAFTKQIIPIPTEPRLPYFYHPSEGQKVDELLFATLDMGLATYSLYKFIT